MDVDGAIAVVTGGASGIGRATALELARRGADVVVADIHEERLAETVQAIDALGRRALAVRCDVSSDTDVEHLADAAFAAFDRVDLVMNNAGIAVLGPPHTVEIAEWERILQVNVLGLVRGVRAFAPAMVERGSGYIVNTASIAGIWAYTWDAAPYITSKFAAYGYSEALARSLRPLGIGVSVLCPGPIATNIARGARNRPDHMGGPRVNATDEAVLAERLATTGLDPKKVGERVLDAIRTKTFYAFVSAVPADVIKARHRRIEEALNSPWVTHY